MEGYAGQQFVGIDLHRRRSVIVRMTESGEVLESVRIVNDADRLTEVIARCRRDPAGDPSRDHGTEKLVARTDRPCVSKRRQKHTFAVAVG